MDIEHKLDLIQQIHREQAYDYREERRSYSEEQELQVSWFASFRFRLLVAVLLFLCFFVMEKKEIKYGGIGATEIVNYIDSNINIDKLSAFMDKNTL